jgi:predicted dehydrogenase
MLRAALKAKKDAYAEKPLSYTLAQSQEMVAAVMPSPTGSMSPD